MQVTRPPAPRLIGSVMLRALFAAFWFVIFAAFLAWVLWGLPPRERRPGDDDDAELPLTA